MEIEIRKDNSKVVLAEMDEAKVRALTAIGILGSFYAADRSPVDTGRLRNSMTYNLGDNCVYIGSNVEYAVYQELGTRKIRGHHMIRDAAQNHTNEYKELIRLMLKG